MDAASRTQRLINGPEKPMLEAFLDFQRDTLLWKLSGLNEAELRRIWTPSGLSLLGLVKHLTWVERRWFQAVFAGLEVGAMWAPNDPSRGRDFRIEPDETAEAVIAQYRATVERSRAITTAGSLDDVARLPERPHTLRRILIHMIEETARHNGHADLMREFTDGATGE